MTSPPPPAVTAPSFAHRLPRVALGLALALLLAACPSAPLPPWDGGGQPPPDASTPESPQPRAPRLEGGAPAVQRPVLSGAAARFPEPLTRYDTPGLAAGRSRASTLAEQARWLQGLVRGSQGSHTRLRLIPIGHSRRGAPIQALVATRAGADAVHARPTVLLVAGQQGNARAAVEALLVMAREVSPGGLLEPLLERINVLMVPTAHPDAWQSGSNGADLLHDHLLLKTPEARALAALVREWRPVVVVDVQESPAAGLLLKKYRAVRRHDAWLQYANSANQNEFITRAAGQWYAPALQHALRRGGLSHEWYHEASTDPQDHALYMAAPWPDSLYNASGLKNAVGLLVSGRGSDLGHTHLQRRVHALVTAATQVLQTTFERSAELQRVQDFVGQETAALACRQTLAVDARQTQEQHTVIMLEPQSGVEQRVRVDWYSSRHILPGQTRARPCGYWLPEQARDAVQRLRLLGLQVLKVAEPGQLVVERRSAQGTVRAALRAEPGSFYLPMNQPLAHLAAAALEPDTHYSYAAAGLLPGPDAAARVMAPTSILFEEEID